MYLKNLARFAITTLMFNTLNSNAAGTISFGEDKSISVGLGIRTDFTSTENGASNGTSRSNDFSLESIRLYMNGSLNKYIKATFNTEKKSDESIQVIDAIAQFEFMPEFNVWAGRMLPGSDRANMDGPYYLLAWQYPGVASRYPSKTTGRDDGVAVWGKLLDSKVIYNIGAYEGHNVGTKTASTPKTSDDVLYAGRIQVDFWEPNGAPAFYTGSTTFGESDVLSVGLAAQFQKNGVYSSTAIGDYSAWNIDFLLEKKIQDMGAVTVEAAYYDYDTDKVLTAESGTAYLASLGYIFNNKIGWGKIQPYFRYQAFDADTNIDTRQYDYGINYVIDGFNAKLSAVYSVIDKSSAQSTDKFIIGAQLQF